MIVLVRRNKSLIPIVPLGLSHCDKHFFHNHVVTFSSAKAPVSKKYSSTLFLPRTSFPMKLEGAKRVERDKEITRQRLADQYVWQRENRGGEEFILHDGPPYANGDPHIGHAVNKILKDITNRQENMRFRKGRSYYALENKKP
jgi:hypothetical protein